MDKKYFEILEKMENEKIDITKLYILSCVFCPISGAEITEEERKKEEWEIAEFTYKCWFSSEDDLDIARLSWLVSDRWQEICTKNISVKDFVEDYYYCS